MKCLSCGCSSNHYLCDDCTTPDILDRVFSEIWFYTPETCENPYLLEYAAGLTEKYAERSIIPDILDLFDFTVSEFYYCLYFKICRDSRFEGSAIAYLQTHELEHIRTQKVLYYLIDGYIPNELIKSQKWCEIVAESDELCCELYAVAAKYFAMIGEYDTADILAEKGIKICNIPKSNAFLFNLPEKMLPRLEKQKEDTNKYRTKKPYWPTTEERRRVVAMFYDERGIRYPRIEMKPAKVPESEFAPINEYLGDELVNYCAFWCSDVYSLSAVKCIYQIAAVKCCNDEVIETFESFVRPWDANRAAKKSAAKEAGIPLEVIEAADDVDIVMSKFFTFVGNDVLVSTDALGNQAKLISRAARYAGMKEINNEFYDLLDMAADTSPEFDLENNTRGYLLSHFTFVEGKTALEKAQINKQLYDALKNFGD